MTQILSFSIVSSLVGFSYGVVSSTAGLSLAMTMTLAALAFGASAQFAVVGIVAAGGSAFTAIASGVALNARFALMAAAIAQRLRLSRLERLVGALLVVDPSVLIPLSRPQAEPITHLYWITGIFVYGGWLASSAIGYLVGTGIEDPTVYGIDVALPALLLALLHPQLRSRTDVTVALAGGLTALVTIPLVPTGMPVVLAAVVPILALLYRPSRKGAS